MSILPLLWNLSADVRPCDHIVVVAQLEPGLSMINALLRAHPCPMYLSCPPSIHDQTFFLLEEKGERVPAKGTKQFETWLTAHMAKKQATKPAHAP